MKKVFLGLLFTTALGTHSFAQSLNEKLAGNWTVTEIALDMNGNNQIEKDEIMKTSCLGLYMNLNANGSGTARMDVLSTREDKLRWSLGNNNTEINFSGEGNTDKKILCYKLADTNNSMHIDKLSGGNLLLSSNENGKMWVTLKKK